MPNTPFICNNLPRKDLVLTYFLYTYALHCLTIGSAKVPDSVSLSPGVTGSAIPFFHYQCRQRKGMPGY